MSRNISQGLGLILWYAECEDARGPGPLTTGAMELANEMELHEVGWEDMDWTDLAQDRDGWRALVNVSMGPLVPQNSGNFLTS